MRGNPRIERWGLALLTLALFLGTARPAEALRWPWDKGPWPRSSDLAVVPLAHPTIEGVLGEAENSASAGYRFVVYGDQRALADGEWQRMVAEIVRLDREQPFLFVLDTGDIVNNGAHADQFAMLTDILAPLRHVPYLVAIGNHELHSNRGPDGRRNTATYLAHLDPSFGVERMYYRKTIGPVRFLFLDSNDLVYGDPGDAPDPEAPRPGPRAAAQIRWLIEELATPWEGRTVVALHHPFLQSSRVYTKVASYLWELDCEGRPLSDRLVDGGVDLVLTGHTHTYERFRVERADGKGFTMLNVSGRPRNSVLWFGADARQARDIEGREIEWLGDRGWEGLDGWSIRQEDRMLGDDDNQFAVLEVGDDGSMSVQMFYLPKDDDPMTAGPVTPIP